MLPFIICAYLLLGCIAIYMSYALQIGFWSLLIFIYPTVLFITYSYLNHKLQKSREEAKKKQNDVLDKIRLENAHEASLEILKMTPTNNNSCDFAQMMSDLGNKLDELGITLNCDFSGYIT